MTHGSFNTHDWRLRTQYMVGSWKKGSCWSRETLPRFNTYHVGVSADVPSCIELCRERERKVEADDEHPVPDSLWTILFKTITGHKHKIVREAEVNTDKTGAGNTLAVTTSSTSVDPMAKQYGAFISQGEPNFVTQPELEAACRALRVALWQAVFYLITSDILGWFNAPYAFRELGYGPGVMVFVFLYAPNPLDNMRYRM